LPRGVTFSSVLHLVILLLVYFGMPSLFKDDDPIERPIPVTVYPMRDETVLPPPQAPEREAEEAPEAEPEPAKEPVPMPSDPDVAHEAPPTPAKPEPAPRVAEAVAPPPPTIPEPSAAPPPPPPKPAQVATLKPRPKPDPLIEEKPESPNRMASLLKSVIESAQQHEIKLKQKQAQAAPVETPPEVVTTSRVTDEPLSSRVSDAIRRQVEDKWNVPAGAANAGDLAVEIRILLMPDGEVRRAVIVDQARLSDTFYQAMAESALRAVKRASPLNGLPPEKYEQWKEITFTFRPPV
jgi:outer membrane biosynthesis protein TonB